MVQLVLNVAGKTHGEIFEEIHSLQEVFGERYVINGVDVPAEDVAYIVRNVDDGKKKYTYYEKRYVGSIPELKGFKLTFGTHQDGKTMYPHRDIKDEEKDKYVDGGNGWKKWIGGTQPVQNTGPVTETKTATSIKNKPTLTKSEAPF